MLSVVVSTLVASRMGELHAVFAILCGVPQLIFALILIDELLEDVALVVILSVFGICLEFVFVVYGWYSLICRTSTHTLVVTLVLRRCQDPLVNYVEHEYVF